VGLTEVDVVMEVEESGLNGTSQLASVWPDLHLLAGTGHRQEVVMRWHLSGRRCSHEAQQSKRKA
jgi:hypothetical protein